MRQIALRVLVLLACAAATNCGGSDPTSPDAPPPSNGGGSGGGGGGGGGGVGGYTDISETTDQNFDDGQWEDVVQQFGAGGSGGGGRLTYQGQQGAFYRQVTITVNDAGGSAAQVAVFSFKQGAVYFPTTDGAIVSIDYSESSINQAGGNGQYSAPAIRQNGKLYTLVPGGKAFTTPDAVWTNHSLTGLTQNDFQTIASAADHPDFSANGARIEVGFMRLQIVQAGGSGSQTKVGIDNYRLVMYRRR